MSKQSENEAIIPVKDNTAALVYTSAEAAKILKIGENRVRDLARDPTSGFPAIRIGRNYKIPKAELEQWIHDETERQMAHRPRGY